MKTNWITTGGRFPGPGVGAAQRWDGALAGVGVAIRGAEARLGGGADRPGVGEAGLIMAWAIHILFSTNRHRLSGLIEDGNLIACATSSAKWNAGVSRFRTHVSSVVAAGKLSRNDVLPTAPE